MNRNNISEFIIESLNEKLNDCKAQFCSQNNIRRFYLDDLLPKELAIQLTDNFPTKEEMALKKSLKEDKFVSAQMNNHHNLLEETLYAFQEPKVVEMISKIIGIKNLEPDDKLYAGGLSRMEQGQYLKPHLDNSHDKNREKYRVLNLLYYVSPNWTLENGGNLQLWQNGMNSEPETIVSQFNRLVVMETHQVSIHSVNQVKSENPRCCISNYYFSKEPLKSTEDYFHVTSFYGTENSKEKLALKLDRKFRNFLRKTLPKNLFKNKHYYKKDN